MGSLRSLQHSAAQSPSLRFDPSNYQVYFSFCPKESGISNQLERYDPSNKTWSHVSPIPDLSENQILKDFAIIALGESVYIIGGRVCDKQKLCNSCEANDYADCSIKVSTLVLRYDVRSGQWSNCAHMGISRYEFACTVCNGKIFVAGGKSDLASPKGISSAEMYDPITDTWSSLPNMRTMKYKCVGVTWNGKIHVVGGFVEGKGLDPMMFIKERSSAEVYDTVAKKWDLVRGMWQLDVPPYQIVEMEGRLFSSGDCLKAWKGHIEIYDGELNMWDEVNGSGSGCQIFNTGDDTQMRRLYLTMAPMGTHLYFFAGYQVAGEMSRTLSKVSIFDTAAVGNAWTILEPMEEEGLKMLCSHCCVVRLS